jgi:hypothetical protein
MVNKYHSLAEQYFSGQFLFAGPISSHISEERFAAIQRQFFWMFDDWYRDYYQKYGKGVEPVKALVRTAFTLFGEAYGHLPKGYKNCAISSGTIAHIDAVARNHHTSDKMARVVGSDWHTRTIKDNSQRSLERVERVKDLFSEVFFIAPTMFEGSTRVYSKGHGRELTGGLPFDGADYMSFWNMVIDQCVAFILDDPILDMPALAQVEGEIALAQSWSQESRNRPILRTSDWANSRNSILEMARGNYVRFGVHPLRPDAKMDMRFYDEATQGLYPATLLECVKPVLQNILRWTPQGIATEEASRTAARLFHLHRMRIDPEFNAKQIAPLNLEGIAPVVADPSHREVQEMNYLMRRFEPFLLKNCAHLIKVDGLPQEYHEAQESHFLKPADIGQTSLKWQREHISVEEVCDLWELTLPARRDPSTSCEAGRPSHGFYVPQRRHHDFYHMAFARKGDEVWIDEPFEKLDRMSKQLAEAHIGVLEILTQNAENPEYAGLRYDLKRGEFSLDAAEKAGVADLSLLPGVMGKEFSGAVREPAIQQATEQLEKLRNSGTPDGRPKPTPAFGSPIVAQVNEAIKRERRNFPGPGPTTPPSEYRLCLEMEMLRRNYTSLTFQKNWETSEDGARMMMLATKIEFGKIKRPGGNDTELRVLDDGGKVISFHDRYRLLKTYLSILKNDPAIKRAVELRDPAVLEGYGIRHISLALARLTEIYDCLKDQDYNAGRFELRRVETLEDFAKGIDKISETRAETVTELCREWCWLWDETDLEGLRQEYRDAWIFAYGRQAMNAGATPLEDKGIRNRHGPV